LGWVIRATSLSRVAAEASAQVRGARPGKNADRLLTGTARCSVSQEGCAGMLRLELRRGNGMGTVGPVDRQLAATLFPTIRPMGLTALLACLDTAMGC
jgi:hypothetical protein